MATGSHVLSLRELVQGRRIFIPPIQRDYAWNVGNPETQPSPLSQPNCTKI